MKTVGLVWLVHLVYLVYLVCLVHFICLVRRYLMRPEMILRSLLQHDEDAKGMVSTQHGQAACRKIMSHPGR